MFSNFSEELKRILNNAKKEMLLFKHSYIGTEHLILSILNSDCNICHLLNSYNIYYDNFKEKVIEYIGIGKENEPLFIFTPLLKKIIDDALMISNDKRENEVGIDLLFFLMLEEAEGVAYRIFLDFKLDINELCESVKVNVNKSLNKPIVFNYGENLNEKVENYCPVIDRDNEINQIIEIILRKNKCNPLLIGNAGVGKTAIVEELAHRISINCVPLRLQNKTIVSISMANLVSGTKYRGEFEEKVLNIINDLENNPNIILFIDEIHTLVGAGGADGAIDASNILKPALSRGKITIIGATTIEEYKKYFEDDKALSRRFQKIIIEEPCHNSLLNILNQVKTSYEKYHNVIIPSNVIEYISNVSKKYILNRSEPDRSIDILDEVSSYTSSLYNSNENKNFKLRKKLLEVQKIKNEMLDKKEYDKAIKYREEERKIESFINENNIKIINNKPKIVKKEYVNKIISQKCLINIFDLDTIDKEVNKIKKELKLIVLNQDNIIDEVLNSIKYIFISDYLLNKPVSLIFNGNVGVGKKYLAEKIGEILFNNNIINIDFNEYSDEQSISRFLGAPPGYVGYNNKNNVFEILKEKSCALIILKNFENAHKKVKNIFYQIINDGYFEESNGNRIEFNNSLLIFITTNIFYANLGFLTNKKKDYSIDLKNMVNKIFNFNNLDYESIKKIIDRKLQKSNLKNKKDIYNKVLDNCSYGKYNAKKIDELIELYMYDNQVLINN